LNARVSGWSERDSLDGYTIRDWTNQKQLIEVMRWPEVEERVTCNLKLGWKNWCVSILSRRPTEERENSDDGQRATHGENASTSAMRRR